jgi:DNA adenine methylase
VPGMQQLTLLRDSPRPAGPVVPPLKWAGGKRWIVPFLEPLWRPFRERRLVELFAGGLAVTLSLRPQKALLNDINTHLINFYRQLQRGLVCDIPSDNSSDTYYAHRMAFNQLIRTGRATVEGRGAKRAAMYFYYLNRHCYNGLCRFNRRGEFNTPMGRYVNPKYERDLRPYKEVMAEWQFTSGDFQAVPLESGDFVYADPPYDDAFTSYSDNVFEYGEQRRLAVWLAEHDGPVVMSNHATKDMLTLYADCGFDISLQVPAPRTIHCFGDRTPAIEVIATRNLPTVRRSSARREKS